MKELRGIPVVRSITEKLQKTIERLAAQDIVPKLAILRIGERPDDLSYERGAMKRFHAVGSEIQVVNLPLNCTQEDVETALTNLNADASVHGILLLRPMPKTIEEERLKKLIAPEKDVDCFGDAGNAGLFTGSKIAYPPCTPQAVIHLLDYYGIELCGKRVTMVGCGMVVGKPLSLLLLARNATVTMCHIKTVNLQEECRRADILIVAVGSAEMITADYVRQNQTVIDVGINVKNGALCGDVNFAAVSPIVSNITPVPGGIGTITTSVLLKHTVESAAGLL